MKKILFAMALLFIITQSCQSPGQKNALDYNNKIANISKENQSKWVAVLQEITAVEQSHDYSKLTTLRNDLVDFLTKRIAEVDAMAIPSGGEDLKQAASDFLQFEKNTAEKALKPYTEMNSQTTDEEIQSAKQALR